MRYVSTRGQSPAIGFIDALLAGLAPDGGLYCPESWPQVSLSDLNANDYVATAFAMIAPFTGDEIPPDELMAMIKAAYATFDAPEVTPLVDLGADGHVLELFHGPTLAFKDVAMQLLGRMFDWALAKRNQRLTIVAATSGDTGGAAVEALAGRERSDLIVLFPEGRISEVQRRFMTTPKAANIHAVAIEGTFDDAQAIVKALFSDVTFRDDVSLGAVNSINWVRILAQSVYYATSAARLGAATYAVPTGNFGDAFAGYVAGVVGVPMQRILIATNANDILARALSTGRYARGDVHATSSPAMDIQIASNFERLLFEALGRDSGAVRACFEALARDGAFDIPPRALDFIRARFGAGSASDAEAAALIGQIFQAKVYTLDPHTAVGLSVARSISAHADMPLVTLATAHPAKFPETVAPITGVNPALPHRCADLMQREERIAYLPADIDAVKKFVREKTRAVAK